MLLIKYSNLLKSFIVRDLKQRYVGSLLGFYWSIINPLVTLIIYIIVFGYFMKVRIPGSDSIYDFSLYFAAGFLPWMAFQSTLLRSSQAIVDNNRYIKKVPFPSEIFPIYITISESVNLIIGFLIYFILFLIFKGIPGIMLFFLPVLILFQIIFTLSFSFLLSALTVFFRDIPQILGSALMIWFWLTPIVYIIDLVPENIRWILNLNPMYLFIELYRDSILYDTMPDILILEILIIFSLFFLGFSLRIFRSVKGGFSELI